ncbi:hypothetical protein [Bacteroides togonis]|uniref:hypothetical protein n=1 Tax=Bacteroides togonis TaxID=1917883 RepID=UPI00094A9CAB|nr:hypothetical protein [Bacteroides togonis]
MELEELKKSWQTLDKHLQNQDITTEERVTELIACYKHKAERKLGNLMSLQRISLCIGLFILIAIGTICLLLPSLIDNTDTRTKLQVVLIFLAVTLIAGGSWDWRTYRYMQQTRVDLLPIAEVSRRIVKLRLWTRQEVAAISLWVLLFGGIYYWAMEFYHLPTLIQAVIIGVFILFEATVIWLLYQHLIYKNLNQIKKDIEDLKDICIESH